MTRSLKVCSECIKKVELTLRLNGFPSQKALAEDLGLALSTVNKFFTGKPVDYGNFSEICWKLGLDWKAIADLRVNPKPTQEEGGIVDAKLPIPEAAPELSRGSVPLASAFYIERPPIESDCYQEILQPGALIRIKAPQQMGKTWLMEKLLEQVALQGYRTVSLSLKLADSRIHFTNLDKFLRWLCTNASRQLGLLSHLDDYWDEEGLGSKVSCTTYVEEYLLGQADTPLVLCLDDVDLVFPYPEIYEDFFALLRSWHEKAKSRKNLWTRLRLVVIHSTEVYIRLNLDQSPFNVGVPIELLEFSQQQVQDLAQQHGLDWDAAQVKQLMKMVEGYPYLVQQALTHIKTHQNTTLDELLATAATESGIYGNHLRHRLLNLQQHPELTLALKEVVTATGSVRLEPIQAYKLHSLGLVKLQGNEVIPRCSLYRQYFCDRLGDV